MKTLLKEKKLRKKGEEKGPKYTKISISHSSSTADKIAPTLPLPHKILNLNKNHFRQTGSGAPVTYCTICRMQSCNRNSVSSFIPNSSASSFFFPKQKRKETNHLPSKKLKILGSMCEEKENQASDPESDELKSERAPPKLVARDSDSVESLGCMPRQSFRDGLDFRTCIQKSTHKELIKMHWQIVKQNMFNCRNPFGMYQGI